jgi:hypothetical protein
MEGDYNSSGQPLTWRRDEESGKLAKGGSTKELISALDSI